MTARMLVVGVCLAHVAYAQTPPVVRGPLRIVVIEGEGGVNIIQQKTAVRPVVEVRDRNNLPVPGALVTFTIQGGKAATFGGASTVTVATNAAGQAAVSSLTPSVAGAVHLQVSAAFEGQLATAAIVQTNVLTAAEAAAASSTTAGGGGAGGGVSAGAGGAAGAGGGGILGLSATTIGIAAAAAAGGTLAAVKTGLIGPVLHEVFDGVFSGSFEPVSSGSVSLCTYSFAVSGTGQLIFDENKNQQTFYFTMTSPRLTFSNCSSPVGINVPQAGQIELTGTKSNFNGSSGGSTIQGSISGAAATAALTMYVGGSSQSTRAIFQINFQKSQ